jgi:hypothetical protein
MTEPGSIKKVLTHLGEPLQPPLVSAARGPPADRGELVEADVERAHDDRDVCRASPTDLPAIDMHSL